MKKCDIPLGKKIKQMRESMKMSQEALAQKINYSRSSVYQLESGRQPCSSSTLFEIKQALGVEDLPFTEPERNSFRHKLFSLQKLIRNNEFDEAKEESGGKCTCIIL